MDGLAPEDKGGPPPPTPPQHWGPFGRLRRPASQAERGQKPPGESVEHLCDRGLLQPLPAGSPASTWQERPRACGGPWAPSPASPLPPCSSEPNLGTKTDPWLQTHQALPQRPPRLALLFHLRPERPRAGGRERRVLERRLREVLCLASFPSGLLLCQDDKSLRFLRCIKQTENMRAYHHRHRHVWARVQQRGGECPRATSFLPVSVRLSL